MSSKEEQQAVELEDIGIEMDSLFETKLKEMEAKLPPKLGELDQNYANYQVNDRVNDKEFCYKFLYCWLNNQDNQTNEDAKAVYNKIIDAYDIPDYQKQNTDSIVLNSYNITFDVGFIINVKTTRGGGGSTIPTQKRRPNKPQKRNRTIKDRVKTR